MFIFVEVLTHVCKFFDYSSLQELEFNSSPFEYSLDLVSCF